MIEFRKVEIKELNRPDQKDSKEIQRFPWVLRTGLSRVAFLQDGLGILSGSYAMEVWMRTGGERLLTIGHNY